MSKLSRYQVIEDDLQRFQKRLILVESDLPKAVMDIFRYVHENLFNPDLNVNLVKERCGIRNNNFSMRFRFTTGIGLREYIEEQRLKASLELMKYEDIEIYMIAMSVGYLHAESFNRAFKRIMGCCPTEYRQWLHMQAPQAECESADSKTFVSDYKDVYWTSAERAALSI